MSKKILLLVLSNFLVSLLVKAEINPRNLTCEYLLDPVGIEIRNPRLSWQLTSKENGQFQSSYRIIVSSNIKLLQKDIGDIWDTRKTNSDESVNINYKGAPLESGKKYYWKIKAWDKNGKESKWSTPASWKMGLLNILDWKAQWIGLNKLRGNDDTSEYTKLSGRYLRKEFNSKGKIEKATAYISGLGLYELYINGKKAGNEVLMPAQTQFNKRVFYNTYEVTSLLNHKKNAIGVILGNGRYFAMRKVTPMPMLNFGFPKLLFQLELEYKDGSKETIISDGSWKLTADGPITQNNEYDGEKYDARKDMPGWNKPGYNDANWETPELISAPAEKITAQVTEPIRITETIKPISIKEIRKGVYIFDMGQNMVGWVSLKVNGSKGDKVKMRFAESLNGDSLYLANIRAAQVTDEYICRGAGTETWEPRFIFHGFRFVEMSGFPGTPNLNTIMGKVVHDDLQKTGTFQTSNETINRIYKNATWGIRGNYRSFPTDCPQRDERHGWLGDRAIGSKGESYIFNVANLYAKWLHDISDAQKESGSISDVNPSYWPLYNDNITWAGTPIVLLDMLLNQYINAETIKQIYPAVKKWYDYMATTYMVNGLMPRDTYGDWCIPPDNLTEIHSSNKNKMTEGPYIGTAYFYYLTTIMEKLAIVTSKSTDANFFASQEKIIKKAFNEKYFDLNTKKYSNNTATVNILALAFNLVDETDKPAIIKNLTDAIDNLYKGHIPTGLIGCEFLMRTLTEIGREDLAFRFTTQTSYPSWGYMIQNGATTIWELWNGNTADPAMNSQNHVMLLGDLIVWYYENLAGIKSDEKERGFKHLVMKPTPAGDLKFVNASYNSLYGQVKSNWNIIGGTFNWDVSVPVNSTATLYIPAKSPDKILINGEPLVTSQMIRITGVEKDRVIVRVMSGNHQFSCKEF